MGHITSYMLGGLAAVASWSMVAPPEPGGGIPGISAVFQPAGGAGPSNAAINRTAKGDRLGPVRPGVPKTVAAIEVVGVHDAAIIYRDRDGNILYRTDPVTNVTVIAKGVKLPDLTVRQNAGSATRPIPVEVPVKSGNETKIPIGCEPVASPIASPGLAHLTGRCISEGERTVEVAAN